MQYLLLIYQSDEATKDSRQNPDLFNEYRKLSDSIKESGQYKGGNALQPVTTATTVQLRDGKTLTTDGPFAETREQLGGYYLIDAEHLDDAIGIAARIPAARNGSIEIRPVWSVPGA